MSTEGKVILRKVVKPGTRKLYRNATSKWTVPVYLEIKVTEKPDNAGGTYRELSICGVEGPLPSGNARGSCGQIRESLGAGLTLSKGWTRAMLETLRAAWDRWHLNGMRAGAPDQEAFIREHRASIDASARAFPQGRHGFDWYATACMAMAFGGVLTSKSDDQITVLGRGTRSARGYQYGHGWVIEALPDSVIEALRALPDSPDRPAWV